MYKRFIMLYAVLAVVILGSVAAVTIIHDPFFQYRNPFGEEPFEKAPQYYNFKNAAYQNPGMAKHFDYDAIITGSSMTQNFDSAYFDELMGVNSLKLSLSGGNFYNISSLVNVALENNPKIKKVFTSLDMFSLREENYQEGNQPPDYLLNTNLLDDVSYLFNKDVLIGYTLNDLYMQKRYEAHTIPRNEAFTWWGMPYGETKVLSQYNRPDISDDSLADDAYFDCADENLDAFWIPLITENPDVEFTFFIPPYSMIFWDQGTRMGRCSAVIHVWKYAVQKLLVYDNVRVFSFSEIEPIVTNLWNYKDPDHYHWRINDYMTECFADGTYRLTWDNLDQRFDALYQLATNFDYEIYFNNPLRSIDNLPEYLDAIDSGKYSVLVSVGAQAYWQLPENIQTSLMDMGITPSALDSDKFYLAVCDNTDSSNGKISEEDKQCELDFGGNTIIASEIVLRDRTVFSIRMNGVEYSQNSDGISFVVYDTENGRVADSVAFTQTDLSANRSNAWCDLPQDKANLRTQLMIDGRS